MSAIEGTADGVVQGMGERAVAPAETGGPSEVDNGAVDVASTAMGVAEKAPDASTAQEAISTVAEPETLEEFSQQLDAKEAETATPLDPDLAPQSDAQKEDGDQTASVEIQESGTETPKAQKSIIDRQVEVGQQIKDLDAKGDNRTESDNARLSELEQNMAELNEFSLLEYQKKTGELNEDEQTRYDELDSKLNPQKEEENSEASTEQQKKQLDEELKDIQNELSKGEITPQQANERLAHNQKGRESLIQNLVKRLDQGDRNLSPFEREVAEKSKEMQQLMYDIQMAPKIMASLEAVIKEQKQKFKEATQFKITPENANSPDARKNVALRGALSRQIAGQATHMARYADITNTNINEFISVNSRLMSLMGVRGFLHDTFVQIGTSVVRSANQFKNDTQARAIVQTA